MIDAATAEARPSFLVEKWRLRDGSTSLSVV
jgi:hypothetical protein